MANAFIKLNEFEAEAAQLQVFITGFIKSYDIYLDSDYFLGI